MNLVVIIGLVLAALACVLTGAMAGQLQSSDPAGNGLAQAYYVYTLTLTWILVAVLLVLVFVRAPAVSPPVPLAWTTIGVGMALLFLLALAGQFISLRWLFDPANRGAWRSALCIAAAVVPLAFVVFAAWRGVGLPMQGSLAIGGCAAVIGVGSLLPFGAKVFTAVNAADPDVITVSGIPYPALLLNGSRSVRVIRYAEDLEKERANASEPSNELLLVDASGATYTLNDGPNDPVTFTRSAEPLAFDSLRARLLRIPSLDPDPLKDAEIRKLVGMQRDVTALSFVLPR